MSGMPLSDPDFATADLDTPIFFANSSWERSASFLASLSFSQSVI